MPKVTTKAVAEVDGKVSGKHLHGCMNIFVDYLFSKMIDFICFVMNFKILNSSSHRRPAISLLMPICMVIIVGSYYRLV